MSELIDGKLVAKHIRLQVKEKVNNINEKYNTTPTLAVVFVGDNPASQIYINNKVKSCEKVNIISIVEKMDESSSQEEVENKIKTLAEDPKINGILVQLPLPKKFDQEKIISLIPENKDVDGLTKLNVANLVTNQKGIVPCTPKGVVDLLKYYNIEIQGKRVAIIGRSMLVGKPLFNLLTNLNATVTLCHSKTKNIETITKESDIVVCALGKPFFLKENMIKEGAVVIDVGINRLDDGRVVGDADFENLKEKTSYITPVPGGCGPMTVAELLDNTIDCFLQQHEGWIRKI